MHRHGYKGRKFNRETDQRRALMKSLADSLIEHGNIETTLIKAKELRPYVEKLVTKAKKGDLHSRRLLISRLHTLSSAHKLVDEIAPTYSGRDGGYLRIERTRVRRGDGAQMARIMFVEEATPAKQTGSATEDNSSASTKATAAPTKQTGKKSAAKTKQVKA